MKTAGQRFRCLPGLYAVCRLEPHAAVPAWVTGAFVNVTRTDDELAVICPAEQAPPEVRAERDWRVLKLVGPFRFPRRACSPRWRRRWRARASACCRSRPTTRITCW